MLRHLSVSARYRSLVPETFSGDAVFGKRTIIYGHNGSGKSALASLLLEISLNSTPVQVVLQQSDEAKTTVAAGQGCTSVGFSVFTEDWVKSNLGGFLNGESANGIITLGSDALVNEEEIALLTSQLADADTALRQADNDLTAKHKAPTAVVRAVQDSIRDVLNPMDPRAFNNNKYDEPRLRERLAQANATARNDSHYADLLARATATAPNPVSEPGSPSLPSRAIRERIAVLLGASVDSDLIEALAGSADRQRWVETGLGLHEPDDTCLFCDGRVTTERIAKLRRHFDESRDRVQNECRDVLRDLEALTEGISTYRASVGALSVDATLEGELSFAVEGLVKHLSAQDDYLASLAELVASKRDSPETIISRKLPADPGELDASPLQAVLKKHAALVESAEQRQGAAREALLKLFIDENAGAFQKAVSDESVAVATQSACRDHLGTIEATLTGLRSRQFSTTAMASALSHDLAHVYGKGHLSVVVSPDGKSYTCWRGSELATHMSEGERNVVALLYFLRSIHGEGVITDRQKHVVVIDDPSSSLDREALFATHSWLLEALGDDCQVIILTHDFEMMRLLLISQKNQLDAVRSVLKLHGHGSNDEKLARAAAEKRFPRAAVLELRAGADSDGARTSYLRPFSDSALRHASEYHYLFDRLLNSVRADPPPEDLFLLPNAARRVIEAFVGFQAPHKPNFEARIRHLAVDERQGEFRDVYDFCNRFSHGEGRELQLALDAETTKQNIRRSLEFLRAVSGDHFSRMCVAVGQDDPFGAQVTGGPNSLAAGDD